MPEAIKPADGADKSKEAGKAEKPEEDSGEPEEGKDGGAGMPGQQAMQMLPKELMDKVASGDLTMEEALAMGKDAGKDGAK